jgi:hypothetical protein
MSLEVLYESEVNRGEKSWLEFIQDMRLSTEHYTLTDTKDFPAWTRYEFMARPEVKAQIALPYVTVFETRGMAVILMFQRRNSLSASVVASFQLLK